MSILVREIKHRSRQIIFPVVGIGLIGYFVYHSVQGDRGVMSYMRIAAEVSRTELKLEKLQTTREDLEHRVSLLHPKSLDRDMLEEQARYTLNYANPNDVIIIDR
ncbi:MULTISPECIES: FtsB family cell division protein [Curvivirga]|uniref:FtsB family cell division protein n=1 Tax=Curvivirga TaxID=2856846 RepID=UPI0012BD4494|nr:septum formation initiator family protein [Curvivirga aplysinae]MTI08670.1 septum formation initiator family protein [Curvivirga aplysinae]